MTIRFVDGDYTSASETPTKVMVCLDGYAIAQGSSFFKHILCSGTARLFRVTQE